MPTIKHGRNPPIENNIIIDFLLDETGSMSSCKGQTISGFNNFIGEQRVQTGKCLFTLTKFDTSGIKTPYSYLDISMVPNMTENTFNPGSMTNLYDAIGQRVETLRAELSSWIEKPRVLFVVMTDGEDNSSHRYRNCKDIEILLNEHPEWTFVYLGANQNALNIATKMGFKVGNIKSFATEEMQQTMQTLSAATVAYRQKSSTNDDFFTEGK